MRGSVRARRTRTVTAIPCYRYGCAGRCCAGKSETHLVDFVNRADQIRTAFESFWGECVFGGGQAAAEARAAEEVDACLRRILGLLTCPDVGGLTLAAASQVVLVCLCLRVCWCFCFLGGGS